MSQIAEVRPGKGRDAGIAFGAALIVVQALVPDGVLTPDGQLWVAGGLGACFAVAVNWVKHRFFRG